MAPSPSSEERGERAVRRSRKRLLEDIEQEESIIFLESEHIYLTKGNFEEGFVHEESVSVDQHVQATVESSNKDTQTHIVDYPVPETIVLVKVKATKN